MDLRSESTSRWESRARIRAVGEQRDDEESHAHGQGQGSGLSWHGSREASPFCSAPTVRAMGEEQAEQEPKSRGSIYPHACAGFRGGGPG